MGWVLKYCANCKKLYSGSPTQCPTCKSKLLVSDYDSDEFARLSASRKEMLVNELFGHEAGALIKDKQSFSSEPGGRLWTGSGDDTEEELPSSGVGSAIKVVAIIVLVLTIIGSFVIMGIYGVAIGVASLISCLLFGLLAYGIGEICTLLTRIEHKLDIMSKNRD